MSGSQITSLSVMDNGNDRCYATPAGCGNSIPPPGGVHAGRDLRHRRDGDDGEPRLAVLDHALRTEPPVPAYSFWGGNVMLLQNGDTEICASEPMKVGTPPPAKDAPSQVIELTGPPSNPATVWQMQVTTGGAYRSYRILSLYPGVIWTK
ncbi:MAG: hypothetical protein ABR576_00425 [Thermoanaerobaculia bacterium]